MSNFRHWIVTLVPYLIYSHPEPCILQMLLWRHTNDLYRPLIAKETIWATVQEIIGKMELLRKDLHDVSLWPCIPAMIKSRKVRWAGKVAYINVVLIRHFSWKSWRMSPLPPHAQSFFFRVSPAIQNINSTSIFSCYLRDFQQVWKQQGRISFIFTLVSFIPLCVWYKWIK